MIPSSIIVASAGIGLLIVVLAASPSGAIYFSLAQFLFSAEVLGSTVRLIVFSIRTTTLFDSLYRELVTNGVESLDSAFCLLSDVGEYENLKSACKVRISTSKYQKANDKLSDEWAAINAKIKFNI